ncbi:hypothetical protein [Bosea sp. (in: a-proteobacteria)]|uniref:hypothetical protein n=1 Tax=Bosea sp. (in: a-proteobacteria) TaxID=1871050 RepID=UPI002B488937|nr:hypothetical protein [Bosea sp. (in: a-proteobacteria)]WRH56669.1 MAG: hypothetical protein RSE11_16705 [Bosea sp. (in: a-proteobacteria)]
MSVAFDPAAVRPNAALLAAVGERLSLVVVSNRWLAQAPAMNLQARRRIEAIIAGLIDALDQLDGDADCEQTAIETRGAGFRLDPLGDEGEFDDNGIGDSGGLDEQMMRPHRAAGWPFPSDQRGTTR